MTLSANAHDSWLAWLNATNSGKDITGKHQMQLFKTLAGTLISAVCKQAIKKDEECTFLFVLDNCTNDIGILVHHLMSIGGSVGPAAKETGFVQATSKHTSFPMIPDIDTLFEKIKVDIQRYQMSPIF